MGQSTRLVERFLLAVCTAAGTLLVAAVAAAQPVPESALNLPFRDAGRLVLPQPSVRSAEPDASGRIGAALTLGTTTASPSAWSAARLVEVPRNDAPGTYSRPHYALGVRSESMRTWLNGLGLDATTCLAPVMRLRSKLSSEGQLSGTLWLSARCDIR